MSPTPLLQADLSRKLQTFFFKDKFIGTFVKLNSGPNVLRPIPLTLTNN